MGWQTFYTAKFWVMKNHLMRVDRKKCLDQIMTKKDDMSFDRVLRSSMVGTTYYAAIETVKNNNPTVWPCICITQGQSSYDGSIWGFNQLKEHDNPQYHDCPTGILSLLSPTDNQQSIIWRECCRLRAAKKKISKLISMPTGVSAKFRCGWIISSPEYRANNYYQCVRYPVRVSKIEAVTKFIDLYGTEEQKREWNKNNINA